MSKKRVLCTIAGQEMVDSSDTEDDDISDSEILSANKKQRVEVNEDEEEVKVDASFDEMVKDMYHKRRNCFDIDIEHKNINSLLSS